jgi:hypothetical protein
MRSEVLSKFTRISRAKFINFLTLSRIFWDSHQENILMINQLSFPQSQPKDGLRPSSGSVGAERPAGAVPPSASQETGPANPRMRIDRDLGMVVIEFRDSAGRVSVSLPTEREIDAYRASIMFGAELPTDLKGLNTTPGAPSAARPGIPLPPEPESSSTSIAQGQSSSKPALNKVA